MKTRQSEKKQTGAVADSFRRWGYLQANLDSLGRLLPMEHRELDQATGAEADRFRRIYSGSTGVEFMHMPYTDRCDWIAARMESEPEEIDRSLLLRRLASAEIFETFLHSRYIGAKRFSLDGGAAMIPLMHTLLERAGKAGVQKAMIGMSHRGRLTVITHIVGTSASHLIADFEDVDPRSVFGSGDVKHHLGATGTYRTPDGEEVSVHLVSNPSHLEAVNPVLMGRVRARQERIGDITGDQILPINLHGDAAFAGQGVTAETLNLANLPGYRVGGTVHVIVNNLIGFTAEPHALHSSRFATDVAKRLPIPIVHVNGEDPEAVVRAARMAFDYRKKYQSDVVVDMICFRRYGHSEIDDPTTTQPLLYEKIKSRPAVYKSYGEQIGATENQMERIQSEVTANLEKDLEEGRKADRRPVIRTLPEYWNDYFGGHYKVAFEVPTNVAPERLHEVGIKATSVPGDFAVHRKVAKLLEQRREMVEGKRRLDWGMAETMAYATLLWDGVPVRITGQDSRRGTFNQRHAVVYDVKTGSTFAPLQNMHRDQARFDIFDSILSEAAALGFEYGFSRDYPDALVIWEAQFGDFANGAQIIIDQFITAGEDKWNLLSGIVMLLPHGYEGQGPEHSSARFERFLQLAGEDNIQVCQPSNSAQYFHMLRRQALRKWRKPLIVMTPKSMLRAEAASSSLDDLTHGSFKPVLDDVERYEQATRVLVCSGKIAHDLRSERKARGIESTAIVTVEQFVPFPKLGLREIIRSYAHATEVVWVQEEPANMGALFYVRPILEHISRGRRVSTVRRTESASPATGSAKAHGLEQKMLLDFAFRDIWPRESS